MQPSHNTTSHHLHRELSRVIYRALPTTQIPPRRKRSEDTTTSLVALDKDPNQQPQHGYWSTNNGTVRRPFRSHAVCNVVDSPTRRPLRNTRAIGPIRLHHPLFYLRLERYPWQVRGVAAIFLLLYGADVLGPRLLLCLCCCAYWQLLVYWDSILSPVAQSATGGAQHVLFYHCCVPVDSNQ